MLPVKLRHRLGHDEIRAVMVDKPQESWFDRFVERVIEDDFAWLGWVALGLGALVLVGQLVRWVW